ncbi:carbohydrate ABC transporter membrane protein 1 (CUT1 family) [Yoonia maricola]|uniref:Carbohydrate ABC transporter membrane protein 1 (CUT1 family) n=1 Tax=Yoonia maricola TaxID=420999 RepID=A0A2M8WLT4_9RHOB|nr:sugar ABC transporter permease [Yoonia maricola]PJI91863.1 carbohydrate ABC transporter membrane protein 1 (CUT1 family) [Yoonia maricola]
MGNLRPMGLERWWVLVFLAPTLVGLFVGAFGSIFASVGISFTDWDLLTPPTPAGFSNYAGLPDDRLFMRSLVNTLAFAGLYVPLTVAISLFVAIGLNRSIPGLSFFRVAFFLPTVSSPTAVGLLWTWIYAQDNGVLNNMITAMGGDPVRWLSRDVALYSVVIVNVWGAIGGGMIIFLAGLQAIPKDYYEVAALDGATAWQRLWFITLPALAPSMFFQMVLTTINAFQAFDYIYILTRTGNGNSTMPTLVFSIYRNGFRFFRMGDAAAQAVVLSAMIMVLTVIYFRLQKKWGGQP